MGRPKVQVPVNLGPNASGKVKFRYLLSDKIASALRVEIESVWITGLVNGASSPYLTFLFDINGRRLGTIVGEVQKDTGIARLNGTDEFQKQGIIVPIAPDVTYNLCNFRDNPIIVQDLKDPKDLSYIDMEITNMFGQAVTWTQCCVMLNIFVAYD
jgi:hypothetical protein